MTRAIVLVVRHPDSENTFTIDGDVEVIDVDYGAGMNGRPTDRDEARYAIGMASSLNEQWLPLPDGSVKDALGGIIDELLTDAWPLADHDDDDCKGDEPHLKPECKGPYCSCHSEE